ncbi:MAG: efflux RND transporter permease subunit [Armatimonadetes bacterium]|nr:efflux RND transporter permease subunit [Armatimonadota bacterium]
MKDPLHNPRYETRGPTALHMIHKWSIEHPYIVLAFYFAVAVMAVIAIGFYMPRRFMPYVESPMVGVVTMMPGLSAEEMELYISKPIEEGMVNIKNLRYIRSTSQDGFSIVSLEFAYGIDMKKALFDVQSLMNVIQANLPATGANLKPSWVLAIDPLNIPVLALSLHADNWDPVKLREFADNTVVSRLKTVPDVYSVAPFGGYRRQLQVIVNREKLAAYGLSILDVRNAVDRYNVTRSGGTLTSGPSEAIVRLDTRATDPQVVMDYPIAQVDPATDRAVPVGGSSSMSGGGMGGGGGMAASGASPALTATPMPGSTPPGLTQSPRIIYVKDVARILDTHWERRSAYHYLKHDPETEGQVIPSIEVAVIQNPEASSWKVINAVQKTLRQIEADYPGVHFEEAYNNADFVGILFENMFHELGTAILLCGIAVFFFLGEWRGTLIAITAIPTSLALAVLGLIPMGMTLNSGTLIGLLLSIGRLVDDTIIDIHSVERHLRMGKDAKTATIDGIAEVRLAVLASTFMIVLALSPLLFSGGIVQLMFVELVWPLILGLIASMLVSFTLTALMCARLLRPEHEREGEKRLWFWRYCVNPFQNFLDRLEAGYARAIAWMLKHRFANMARILATVIIGFGFYHFIGSEMMPLADVGQAYGLLEMKPGTSFERTEQAVHQIERIMLKYPEIEKASVEIGTETMLESTGTYFTGYAMPAANAATFMITLSDMTERERDIWQVIDGVQAEVMRAIPDIRRFQIKEMGSDVMASSLAPIALLIYGPDLKMLDRMGQETLAIARETNGMFQPATSWTMGLPDYEVRVDPRRAQELGLTVSDIAEQAYYALRGGFTNEYYRLPNLRQNTVLVRYEPEARADESSLENLYITAPGGRTVPLKSVATVERREAPTLIEHDNLRRVISVLGYYRRGFPPSMDVTMDLEMKAMSQLNFPPGYGMEVRGDMTQMMDSFRRLLNGLIISVIFILLVLVAQFRGFLQPLQMIFSLPLELSGVFIALFLTQQAFSTVSIMAIIVLTGMDITTAILLIDMIMRYRDRGVPRDQAVMEACPQRLRPILMTSIITIIVMVPVAFFPKTGIDAYAPLGVVIIGGLIVGTILSLFDIPIMHTYVDDLIKWLNRTFLRREWEWPVTESPEGEPLT